MSTIDIHNAEKAKAQSRQGFEQNSEQNSEQNNDQSNQQNMQQLSWLVGRWRKQFLQQQTLLFIPKLLAVIFTILFLLFSLGSLGDSQNLLTFEYAVGVVLLAFMLGVAVNIVFALRSERYRSITLKNLLVHLNNRFIVLEDSAQLLLRDESELSGLEKLQYQKVRTHFQDILQQQAHAGYPELSPVLAKQRLLTDSGLLLILLLMLLLSAHFTLFEKTLAWFYSQPIGNQTIESSSQNSEKNTAILILSQQVTITFPNYSVAKNQAGSIDSKQLDINTLVGSQARWTFTFSQQAANYFIVFSNGERYPLVKQDNNNFTFEKQLTTSMVYHLAIADNSTEVSEQFAAIHRITLIPDQAPKIRFISPKNTVTEFGKNSTPTVLTEVQISDDFALTAVEILASIAKGSGESVKFRDQRFNFDRTEQIDGKTHYYKNWSLLDLAMEPGDELYFTVLATDNRQPEAQQTRSATKIIRWLEDEQASMRADGILLDFMPEYFKSQRQIIIETIELIEDKTELESAKFTATSESLGVAQSALKEKYGQYLGDESEGLESVGVSFDDDHSADEHSADEDSADEHSKDEHDKSQRPTIQVHDEHGGSNAVITATAHEHVSAQASSSPDADLSGRMSLINRYGHTHEDSDVGMMNSQDPKALMKKSLANMWQAELHLMLAEPELALPFEQQALMLLKQAQKAERIYVKRLGFEPPPVTEQRRYQGEQTDIISGSVQSSRFSAAQLTDQTQLAFRQLLQLLNRVSQTSEQNVTTEITNKRLSVDELALVELAKQGIEQLVEQRSALVDVLAILEQILLERKFTLSQCQHCLTLLSGKLEQLIPQSNALPARRAQDFFDQLPMIQQYSEFLEENL